MILIVCFILYPLTLLGSSGKSSGGYTEVYEAEVEQKIEEIEIRENNNEASDYDIRYKKYLQQKQLKFNNKEYQQQQQQRYSY